MNTQTEPLPCPFCGERLLPNNNQDDLYVRRYGTHYRHPSGTCYMADIELGPAAAQDWNRRASPAQVEAAPQDDADKRDAARLDWVAKTLFERKWCGTLEQPSEWYVVGSYRHITQKMRGETIRAAIDAAIAASAAQGEKG
ncbi:MAG: hypothetical protein NVS1B6_19720 [Steroidobacteraceae bacterium]